MFCSSQIYKTDAAHCSLTGQKAQWLVNLDTCEGRTNLTRSSSCTRTASLASGDAAAC